MSRTDQLKRNAHTLFWGYAFSEFKILNAIATLFYLHRGVSIDQVFYLSIVWSVVTLLLEVPTGYLADRFGRKRTILIGAALLSLSWVAAWFANGFPAFVGVFVLMSASFACFSGTADALLYDSLKELGEEKRMTATNGRVHAAKHLFKIFVPAAGAWIASGLLESQFRILIGIDFIATLIAFVIFLSLTEPKHTQNVTEKEKDIFRDSIDTIRREPFLLRATMNKLLIFIATLILWRSYQPYLVDHGIPVAWLGIFYIIFNGSVFFFHWHLGVIERRLGAHRILLGTVLATAAVLTVTLFIKNPIAIFILLVLPFILESIREPVFAHTMNSRIASRSRATTLSNLNFFKAVLDIPILFLAGSLAKIDLAYVFMISIALCLTVLLFFPIRVHELAAASAPEELEP